ESKPAEKRPERHESLAIYDFMVSRWRDKVTSRPPSPSGSSSHDIFAPSSEFSLLLLLPHLGFIDGLRFFSDTRRLFLSVDLTAPILMVSPNLLSKDPRGMSLLPFYDFMVSRWRDRVTSRPPSPSGSSSHDIFAPSSEFSLLLLLPHLGFIDGLRFFSDPRRLFLSVDLTAPILMGREAIPFSRPYRTHPDGSCKFLTARKRVGPFPARRLAWRRVSHHSLDRHSSPDFTSDSSSSGSSSDSTSD
nr:hypothetical protein [Tanacetum cinerariifolium]